MANRLSQNDNEFIVIRHMRETDQYAVEYGRAEAVNELNRGPRFDTLEGAIAWVEALESGDSAAASRR